MSKSSYGRVQRIDESNDGTCGWYEKEAAYSNNMKVVEWTQK